MSLPTVLRAITVAMVAAASLALAAPAAQAGSYEIRQCQDAAGKPIGISDGFMTAPNMSVMNGCTSDTATYSLRVANDTLSPWGSEWQAAGVQYNVPSWMPNTVITAVHSNLSVAPKNGDATLSHGNVLTVVAGGKQWSDFIPIPAGYWGGFFNLDYARADAEGGKIIQTLIQCYGPCDFQSSPTMMVNLPRVTLTEYAIPNAATVEGSGLTDGSAQRGSRTLAAAVTDNDSGVQRVEVRTPTGVLAGSTANGAGCSATRPAPCPQSRPREEIKVDTTKFAEGQQPPQLWIYDAAGNVRKQTLAAVLIDNIADVAGKPETGSTQPAPGSAPNGAVIGSPNGTGGDPATGVVFMKKGTEKRTVNFGAKVTMKSQLVDAAGVPIQNANVDVLQRIDQPGAPTTPAGTVTTGADGRFTYAPPTGASRTITFAYAAVTGSTDYRWRLDARLTVRAKVTFSVSKKHASRGSAVRFAGKLWVDPLPLRSARVVIETRAKGGKAWFTAATVRTREAGAFKWSGRFRSRGTYVVRARVLGSSDVAARPTASRTISIRVR